MNSLKKISKIVLLYGTILYSLLYLIAAESLSFFYIVIGLAIVIVLVGACYEVFKDDDLENYVPKWFR
jgi:hypothetical protein